MNAALVMFKADGTRRDFPIEKERVVLGRTNTCDLRIPLSSVSRQHCELLIDGEEIRVRDLGSSNGTYHNSNRVQEASLSPGDEIVVGPVVFTLVVDGEPSQIKPVKTVLPAEQASGGSSMPEEIEVSAGNEPLPAAEEEHGSPTVDLDDPIAALEAMSDEDEDEELPMLAEEDEENNSK